MWILCWHWLGAMFQSMINISQIFFPFRLFVLLVLCSEQQNRCTLSNPDKTEFNTMQFSHLVGSKLTHYCLNGCRNVFEQNFACSQPIKIMIKWFFFPQYHTDKSQLDCCNGGLCITTRLELNSENPATLSTHQLSISTHYWKNQGIIEFLKSDGPISKTSKYFKCSVIFLI